MITRKANINDLEQLVILFDQYRMFYHKNSDIKAAYDFLKQRLNNNESVIYIVEDKSHLLGFTQLFPIFSSTRMKRAWLLNDLFVAVNQRGKGISIQLINKAKLLAKETNACSIMLETAITNDIGNQLYPKVGFELNTEANFYEWHNNL